MRPVQLADIEAAARVLLLAAPPMRMRMMQDMVRQADAADRYCRSRGQSHPIHGSGALLNVAYTYARAGRPAEYFADALQAISIVIKVLEAKYDTSPIVK